MNPKDIILSQLPPEMRAQASADMDRQVLAAYFMGRRDAWACYVWLLAFQVMTRR